MVLESRQTTVTLRDIARHFKLKWEWDTPIHTYYETDMFQRVEKITARYRQLCETYFKLTGRQFQGE